MLKLLIIILCIYVAFRYIIRPMLTVYIQNTIKKAVDREKQKYGNQRPRREEGSIHVDYVPENHKTGSAGSKEGEYIDYEEVK